MPNKSPLTDPLRALCAALAVACAPTMAGADVADVVAAEEEDGKFVTEDGTPTFKVEEDGTVDWYTFSGFRRYHSECHVCHGPDGMGSTYAPPLREAVMRMDYYDFVGIVAAGIDNVDASGNSVMPALGLNANVMCYIDDIWIYLRARGVDAVPRGRPAKRMAKPDSFVEAENACMG
jgi:methanol metabolism-related c-type cytochrome